MVKYIEPSINRYLFAKASRNAIPLSGTFELTPCCNLNCRMCYVRKSRDEADEEGRELSAEQWLTIARAARDKGMLYLLLTGGEPLLRSDFKEIYTELKKLGLMISINTNGTMIDEKMVEFLAKDAPTRVNVSLYGTSRETYKRLCGNPDAYEKVLWSIRSMSEKGISVKLNLSVTPYNCADIEGVFNIAKECNVQLQSACYMYPPLRKSEKLIGVGNRFSPEEAARYSVKCDTLRFTNEQFLLRAESLKNRSYIGNLGDGCMDSPTEHIKCRAGASSFWVTWNGRMTPCGMMTTPYVDVCRIGFDSSWIEINKAVENIMIPAKCTSCNMRHACSICPASCYAETGSFEVAPEYVCKLTKAIIRETLQEHKRMKENVYENKA